MAIPIITARRNYISFRKAEIIRKLGKLYIEESSKDTTIFKTDKERLKDLKVACIVDEFTYNSYAPECNIFQLTPNNWKNEIRSFQPDLLFIESAWEGKDKLWHRKISYCSEELVDLINHCRLKTVPVVFWNKEDPTYTDTFMAVAKICDWIFTTDIDCVGKYKNELKHNNVSHLHFAAQPLIHNPIEKYTRKDKFCFAGAYYHKYQERCKIFDEFSEVFISEKGLDIYDRNYHDPKPEYAFPENYNQHIKGSLKSTEIDKAYKGYHYGINMNSVSQSQTMFARRAFELMASNTIVVGNYARGIKNLFGDLTICTDDAKTLNKNLDVYCSDEMTMKKYKLQGLRKVLKQHLYEDRLNYICKKVFKRDFKSSNEQVNVVGFVETNEQAQYLETQFLNQSYDVKKLYIITDSDYKAAHCGVTIIASSLAGEYEFGKLFGEDGYVSVFNYKNYYGKNYLLDLMLTRRYLQVDAMGKAVYYKHDVDEMVLIDEFKSYVQIDSLILDRSVFSVNLFVEKSLAELREMRKVEAQNKQIFFSTDMFNFCENFQRYSCEWVDDLTIYDIGLGMEDIQLIAEGIELREGDDNAVKISGVELAKIIKSTSENLNISTTNDEFYVVSNLVEGQNEYAEINRLHTLDDYVEDGILRLKLDITGSLNVILACIFFDENKKKLTPVFVAANRQGEFEVPGGAHYFRLSIRFSGNGSGEITQLIIGEILNGMSCFLSRSNVLVLTNHYPSSEELYRNMFVHKRMEGYKKAGKIYEIMRFYEWINRGYREFDGMNITEGQEESLEMILKHGSIDTVCVHFLDSNMWSVLKNYVDKVRIIVWSHGADIQPWWRRKFNYTDDELEMAKEQSETRMTFWSEIFEKFNSMNMHFIFVSQHFADMVMQDYKVHLKDEDYSIIHNFIDTDMFGYIEKSIEKRLKILSVRPYSSRIYGNDLAVKTVLELQKEEWFGQLEFKFVGDGVLFDETVEPLNSFSNVSLESRFLTQKEIADLHKRFGIFLVPTRGDTQGVSRDEAMSSGLVPVTNAVAAIPEFVDEKSGMLVDGEDWKGMADAIRKLYYDPELFNYLSRGAAERVRNQTSYEFTIAKEIELIENIDYSSRRIENNV